MGLAGVVEVFGVEAGGEVRGDGQAWVVVEFGAVDQVVALDLTRKALMELPIPINDRINRYLIVLLTHNKNLTIGVGRY